MRTLDHPNVISLFQLIESEKRTYIIMELVKGQQLYYYIKKSGYLQEDDARRIFRQMLNAMSYCHELGIIHRDLKPDNIMVDRNGHVTVIDFGLGTKVKPGQKIIFPGGLYKFGAPEQLLHKPYDGPKADVWALGVTLYLMVTGKYPFGDVISGLKSKIVHGMYTVPSILSKELKDLLRRLLSVDPRHRPTAQEAIGHPWLKETEASQAKEKKKEVPSLPDAAIVQAMQCIGFKREDIEESVINKKFDECMASYYFLKGEGAVSLPLEHFSEAGRQGSEENEEPLSVRSLPTGHSKAHLQLTTDNDRPDPIWVPERLVRRVQQSPRCQDETFDADDVPVRPTGESE
ncbi:hypothetical protein STEG23_028188 [Scotinomys teguina]